MPGLAPTILASPTPKATPKATSAPRTGDSPTACTATDHEGISRARLRHDWQSAQSDGPDSPIPIPLAVAGLGLDSADQQRRIRAATATVHGSVQRTLARGTSVDVRRQVLTGLELVLCGKRTDLSPVATWAGLDLATEVSRRVATMRREDSLAERQIRDDTSHRAGPTLVEHAPIAHTGMTGKASPTASYPIGQPGCASAVSRQPLPSPGPHGLLSAGWLGLDVGGLSRVDAIGGRAISPQYRATTTRKTRRGKKGGKRHKIPQ